MSHLGTGSLCDESMALENLPSSAHPHSLSEELILQDVAAGSERSLALDQNSLASGINDNLDGELDSLYGAINAERSIPDSDPSFDEMLRDAAFDEVTIDPTFQHVMDTIKTATTNRNYAIPASLVLHETIHSADEGTLTVSISLPSQPYDRVLSTDAIVAAMKLDENVQITRESVSEPRESQRT